MTDGNDRREFVRVIYAEHWEFIRALQRDRTLFLLVFVVLIGFALLFLKDSLLVTAHWPIHLFLVMLSLLGIFVALKTQIGIRAHLSSISLIASRYSLAHYLPRYQNSVIRRTVRLSRLIPIFYLFWLCFFLWALLNPLCCCLQQSVIVPAGIFVLGAMLLFLSKFDEPLPYEKED